MSSKTHKRLLSAILAAVPLAVALAGCAHNQSQNDTSVPKAPPVANTAPGGGLPPGVGRSAAAK